MSRHGGGRRQQQGQAGDGGAAEGGAGRRERRGGGGGAAGAAGAGAGSGGGPWRRRGGERGAGVVPLPAVGRGALGQLRASREGLRPRHAMRPGLDRQLRGLPVPDVRDLALHEPLRRVLPPGRARRARLQHVPEPGGGRLRLRRQQRHAGGRVSAGRAGTCRWGRLRGRQSCARAVPGAAPARSRPEAGQ